MNEKYGQTQSEEELEKILDCRKIVKEIINFGVSQEQIMLIIQFLAAELENHENMIELVELVREMIRGDKLLLIDKTEETNGPTNN